MVVATKKLQEISWEQLCELVGGLFMWNLTWIGCPGLHNAVLYQDHAKSNLKN